MEKRQLSGLGSLAFRAAALLAGFLVLQASNCSDNVGTSSPGPTTFRVSTGPNDTQSDGASTAATVSADGRYVAFVSQANDLASQPTGFREVFVKDRLTGNVQNMSRMASAVGPADCDLPFISANGQWVVFQSKANYNGAAQATTNIFLTTNPPGNVNAIMTTQPDADATNASIADTGTSLWCVFQTAAKNILLLPNPGTSTHIYGIDLKAFGTTFYLVDHVVGSSTTFPSNASADPVISGDGSTVAFDSSANNLVTGGNGSVVSVYVGTPNAGGITLVSTGNGLPNPNTTNGNCLKPAVSTNGNLVAFTSEATTLATGEAGHDVLLRNISAQTTTLVATDVLTLFGFNVGFGIGLSDNGRFLAYTSRTDRQVYFVDMQAGISLASVGPAGVAGDQPAIGVLLTPDGKWLFWQSAADNLILEDSNGATDIFGRGPLP